MKYCRQCGAPLEDDAKICPRCGTSQKVKKKSQKVLAVLLILSAAVACISFVIGLRMDGGMSETAEDGDATLSESPEDRTFEKLFPDEKFRAYLLDAGADADGDGVLSQEEAEKVTDISVGTDYYDTDGDETLSTEEFDAIDPIKDLSGIRYFSNLKTLDCSWNEITTLDISGLVKLTELECSGNELTKLDISTNNGLTHLECNVNELAALDISKNTNLTLLWCSGNELKELDTSNNPELTDLDCSINEISKLDVSDNTQLGWLQCSYNALTSLDVTNNTQLWDLDCNGNQLTELDVSNNPDLEFLTCEENNITTLDLTHNPNLTNENYVMADSDVDIRWPE